MRKDTGKPGSAPILQACGTHTHTHICTPMSHYLSSCLTSPVCVPASCALTSLTVPFLTATARRLRRTDTDHSAAAKDATESTQAERKNTAMGRERGLDLGGASGAQGNCRSERAVNFQRVWSGLNYILLAVCVCVCELRVDDNLNCVRALVACVSSCVGGVLNRCWSH